MSRRCLFLDLFRTKKVIHNPMIAGQRAIKHEAAAEAEFIARPV
jgi:hypothetical protein